MPIPYWPRLVACSGLAALGCAVGSAAADPAPPFRALLVQAQAGAPRPAEAAANVAQAEGLARQAAVLPNPTLSVEVENFAGSGPFRDTGASETTASLGQTIELGGKREARVGAARAEVRSAEALARRSNAEFAFDLADAYAQAEASERRLQLASETLAFAEEDGRVANALVRAGKEADIRAVQARAAIQTARAGVDEARAARASAFGKLTALSGSPAPLTSIPVSLLAHADQGEPVHRPDPLASPAYQAALAEREAVARKVRVERLRSTPDVTVSVGVRRFEADKASALVAGVSAPFPLFDRNRGNVSAVQAELRAAEARLNAARLDAEAEATSATARAEAALTRIAAAREGEAAAEEAARLARVGYEGGKLSLLELLTARRGLAEARTHTIEARLERLSAEAALARLQGVTPFGDQP